MNLWMFSVELENQFIVNVYHVPNIYQWQNNTYLSNVLEQKCNVASFNIPMLTWFLSIVTHYIPNIKRMTNERLIFCIHTVCFFVSHNTWNID